MLLFRLMSVLMGYVVIMVTGEAPERFVNMATSGSFSPMDDSTLPGSTFHFGIPRLRPASAAAPSTSETVSLSFPLTSINQTNEDRK